MTGINPDITHAAAITPLDELILVYMKWNMNALKHKPIVYYLPIYEQSYFKNVKLKLWRCSQT